MSEFDTHGPGSQEGDQVDRAEDVLPPRDPSRGQVEGGAIADQVRSSDLVADVTLARGVTYTPAGLRVLQTSYVFRINRAIRGDLDADYVTINDTGGVYPDGSTVSTERSFRLSPGGRYIVFARTVGDDLWLQQVLQVHDDGAAVADASGRILSGFREGVPIAQAEPTYEPLRYVQSVAKPVDPMEGPPDEASVPLPESPASADVDTRRYAPMSLETVVDHLRAAESHGEPPEDVPPTLLREDAGTEEPPPVRQSQSDLERRSQASTFGGASEGPARAVLMGSYVTAYQSHYHYMPDDNNWAWTSHCRGSWNALVNNNLGLFAFKIRTSDNQPIRDRLPVARNNENNVGVLSNSQMTAGGYHTWDVLGANGVCYHWEDANKRVVETDILINPKIAGDEAQFRKSLTHELGHALTLDHETARMALMYPGTYQQPPNYASLWYSRQDDHHGVRSMLDWVNTKVAAGTWDIAQFADMATWSQAHDNPGTAGKLVMTRLSSETFSRGDTVTVQYVHVENRGNIAARNVRLKFYLSTDEIITENDREIGSFTWNTFTNWWTGSLNVRIPDSVPAGQYFVGWIVTTDTPERSGANNTALLMRDYTTGFTKVRVTVK